MSDDNEGVRKPRLKWLEPNYDRFNRSKKHENRLASKLGGRRLPQSGAQRLSKYAMKAQTSLDKRAESVTMNGDLVLPDFWVEHKRTDTATMSIKREWWEKLVEGARTSGREPALLVTFEKKASPSSKPLDLVLLPLECFERLRGKKP